MNIRSPCLLATVVLAGCSSMGYGSSGTNGSTNSSPDVREDGASTLPAAPHLPPPAPEWRAA